MKRNHSKWIISLFGCLALTLGAAQSMRVSAARQAEILARPLYLPLIYKPLPAPSLAPIPNLEQDNYYSVSWTPLSVPSTAYVLEESVDAAFTGPVMQYQGTGQTWAVPYPGKTPATYYYRVKATNGSNTSAWSNIQSVTIYPLYAGLFISWDGLGYIRGDENFDVGYHMIRDFTDLYEGDILESSVAAWYDPNPKGWSFSSWYSYYSVTTGEVISTSNPSDPDWKWDDDWRLPYSVQLVNGQIYTMNGQAFTVSGPTPGTTVFGAPVQYWELVNRDKFVFWDGGQGLAQYCHPGDVILRYDAGNSKLELYSSVLRRYYDNGNLIADTVQYITNLTGADSIPSSPSSSGSIPAISTVPGFENGDSRQSGPEY